MGHDESLSRLSLILDYSRANETSLLSTDRMAKDKTSSLSLLSCADNPLDESADKPNKACKSGPIPVVEVGM